MPTRTASAQWTGTLKEGNGSINSTTGAVSGQYSVGSRFEEGTGTNPEELLAAAHAACFSMAFTANLEKAGFNPEKIVTTDNVHIEKLEEGWKITLIEIQTEATVSGIENDKFQEIALETKAGCPVSKALASVTFELDAKMV